MRVDAGLPVAQIAPARTRFHLAGDVHAAFDLLMWITTYLDDVVIAEPAHAASKREVSLGNKAVHLIGYEDPEALFPLASAMFPGFRLIEEYYTLPQKFAFFEIEGLGKATALGETVERFDILLRFTRALPPEFKVDREWVKLHCVPVANVFPTTAEPIRISPTREQFLVRPAGLPPGHAEVYAITKASAVPRGSVERIDVPSFFDFSHAHSLGAEAFYTTHLTMATVGDGADVSISFGSAENSSPVSLDADVVSLDLLATNGRLAGTLRAGDICTPTIGSPAVATFRNLGAVSPPVPVTLGRELHWRAVAHASMGLRSLATVEVLRGMLDIYNRQALHDRHAARANELRVAAIQAVRVSPLERLYRGAPIRGVAIDVDVDEKGFLGDGDVFVFSAILDRLFASYVSINSFSRTSLRGTGTNLRFAWPPRSGNESLL
jgi:type VI secretion system protein ImpG